MQSKTPSSRRHVDEATLLSDRIVMITNGPAATAAHLRCRAAMLEFLYARHGRSGLHAA